jgi:flagellar motility protein MotE (MotC chaperone)
LQQADSVRQQSRLANTEELATFYNKMKAGPAAEILQEGTLGDTTVAMLLLQLTPQHMAKIMASMDADFAARITKLMQDLPTTP